MAARYTISYSTMKKYFFKALFNLVVPLYGWYLKGVLSLRKSGVVIQHPLHALFSRHHIHHAMILGLSFITIGHTAILQSVDEQEFLLPLNAIARLFAEEDQFIVETRTFTPVSGKEYAGTDAIRSQPTPSTEQGAPTATPPSDTGYLAVIPDSLIKPILPLIQTEPQRSQTISTHVVKSGDTLGSIARQYGLKISTLLWANNLTERSLIRIGQRLVILPVDGIHYRVQRGDTLGAIARRYESDIDKIIKANQLRSANAVAIGELLIIPDGVMPRQTPSRQERSLIARVRESIAPSGTSARSSGFIWPTTARRVTQYFSWRHTGVDIAGPPSNKIYAAAAGTVSFAGWATGYGLSLVIDHGNGQQTRYAHSRQLFVKKGQQVSQGETIAMVGSTGRSTGPHLHFEIIKNGRRVNPFTYIR